MILELHRYTDQFTVQDWPQRKMLDENSKHTMSSNISKETLLETFRKLLTCDADIKKDFIIESEDRDGDRAKLHVHSSIFTMHPCAQ